HPEYSPLDIEQRISPTIEVRRIARLPGVPPASEATVQLWAGRKRHQHLIAMLVERKLGRSLTPGNNRGSKLSDGTRCVLINLTSSLTWCCDSRIDPPPF